MSTVRGTLLPVQDAMGPRPSPWRTAKITAIYAGQTPVKGLLSPLPFVDGGVARVQVKTFFTREHRLLSQVYSLPG